MANITISLDDNDKRQLAAFCDDVGISMSALFNMFTKKVLSTWEIPFRIGKPKLGRAALKAVRQAEKIAAHPERHRGYDDLDEMWKDLGV